VPQQPASERQALIRGIETMPARASVALRALFELIVEADRAVRSAEFAGALVQIGATHRVTRPYRPQTNGKVERFNRTLLEEWAYARLYRSNQARTDSLPTWLET
jgi:transposase InsO family protein